MQLPSHGRYDYSPITDRPDYSWPGGKRLALYFGINVEHFAFGTGLAHHISRPGHAPDPRTFSWMDYGNRVGFWRILDVLDAAGMPACHLVNTAIFDYAPQIVQAIMARGDEFIGHGRTNAERTGELWEADEERVLRSVYDAITETTGVAPRGSMSPWMSHSMTTPDLLQEIGFTFLMDWPFDDQPIWMKTRNGRLLSVPYPLEINDSTQIIVRQQSGIQFEESIIDQFDELIEQSDAQPLVCGIALHTSMVGQPHRLRGLRRALSHILEHPKFDQVWLTRPGEIYDHCAALPAGVIPGS